MYVHTAAALCQTDRQNPQNPPCRRRPTSKMLGTGQLNFNTRGIESKCAWPGELNIRN